MTRLQSTAAPASPLREYDPEIKDIAEYVHNYSIDSDLAVRLRLQFKGDPDLTLC